MEDIFIKILNMSITASYFVIALVIIRAVFRKIPKWLSCVMWGLVGLRLILPFSFESILSLIPSAETIPSDIALSKNPQISSGVPVLNNIVNPVISESFTPDPSYSVNPLQVVIFVLSVLWLTGIAVMLVYTLVSYGILRRKTRESIRTADGTYICDVIEAPFILGIIKPKIYIPSSVTEADRIHIIAHENAHIKRFDHLWKPLGFLLLSVYWFNPLMWTAYIFLSRDIEAACDERVLKNGGAQIKKSYSEALINCSVPKHLVTACPLAFGETGVKSRIKNVLSYKKPTLWIIIFAIVLSIILSVCFMTNPTDARINDIPSYADIFRDVEKLQFFTGENRIYTTEDPSAELRIIKRVRVGTTQDALKPDAFYKIEINDTYRILFDKSFSYLWLENNELSASPVYLIKAAPKIKDCFPNTEGLGEYTYETELEGIYMTLDSIETNKNGSVCFNVTWHNETENEATYGESFTLLFNESGDEYLNLMPADTEFSKTTYILKPYSTERHTFTSDRITINRDGSYSLRSGFVVDGHIHYVTKVFFSVTHSDSSQSPVGGAEGPVSVVTGKQLTLDDVLRLSKKGDKLSWKDFENYNYTEIGSGLYIRSYRIDERFSLIIGSSSPDAKPMYIYLYAPGTYSDAKIDIRNESPEEFIENHKAFSVVRILEYSQRGFPVDNTGENFQAFIDYGCFVPHSASSIQYLPVIMIENKTELDNFIEYFNNKVNLNKTFKDMGMTFREVCALYDTQYKDFFKKNVLFISYAVASNEDAYFEPGYASIADKNISIAINEINVTEISDLKPIGWFIISEINRDQLTEFDHVSAFIDPEPTRYPAAIPSETYAFKESGIDIGEPNFTLFNNGRFIFNFHPASSYIGYGVYKRDGQRLTLTTDDGSVYCFTERNGAYVFDADNSADNLWMSDVSDGSEFVS